MISIEEFLSDPKRRKSFEQWAEWHYITHVRTPERFRMFWNHKTAEILDDMITDEIIRRSLKQ